MKFKTFYKLNESEDSLEKFQESLLKKFPLEHLRLYRKGSDLILDMVVVNKSERMQGIGSKVLEEICDYADQNHLRILLTTAVKDNYHGTTSMNRLKDFYKKFGFVENKGRNKDFTTLHNMIRNAKKLNEDYLKESASEDLVIVDIQPAYKKSIHFSISKFCDFLIESDYRKVLYLYNGPDLGLDSEDDVMNWLIEDGLDYDEEKIDNLPNMNWFEKGYAFFRNMMDVGYDEEDIIKTIKKMLSEKVNDSRDLEDGDWKSINVEPIPSGDCIFIPDVLDVLENYNNIVLVGGGKNECLKEVEICLKVLGKPYKTLDKWVY